MWVELSVGGAADLAKWNPEPSGGEAYTDLLCAVKSHASAAPRRARRLFMVPFFYPYTFIYPIIYFSINTLLNIVKYYYILYF
jgi:hypothetical protein